MRQQRNLDKILTHQGDEEKKSVDVLSFSELCSSLSLNKKFKTSVHIKIIVEHSTTGFDLGAIFFSFYILQCIIYNEPNFFTPSRCFLTSSFVSKTEDLLKLSALSKKQPQGLYQVRI